MDSKTYLTYKNDVTYVHNRQTGETMAVYDIGRCYVVGGAYVAKGAVSSFDALVRRVRRDILHGGLPILDVHATGRYV